MEGKSSIHQLKPVAIDDLLGRTPVTLNWESIHAGLAGKSVLVTGGGGSIGAASKVRSLADLFTIIGTPTSSSSNSKPVLSLSSKDCFIAQHLVRTIERLMVIQARQDRGYDMKRNSSNTPYDDVFPSETLAIWTATSLDNGTDGNLTTNNSMLAEEERKSMRQSVKGIVATLQRIVSGESSSSTMAATIDGGQQQQFRPSVLTNSV